MPGVGAKRPVPSKIARVRTVQSSACTISLSLGISRSIFG
jgi:hypothetical protein